MAAAIATHSSRGTHLLDALISDQNTRVRMRRSGNEEGDESGSEEWAEDNPTAGRRAHPAILTTCGPGGRTSERRRASRRWPRSPICRPAVVAFRPPLPAGRFAPSLAVGLVFG